MSECVHVERPSEGVVLARLDRPPVNALDREARRAFLALLDEAERDHALRCVVLTGTGRHFCAGADLREEAELEREDAGDFFGELGRILAGIRQLRIPVIAAVNGHCLGGGLELALMCDIRIGSTDARFTASGVNVGLVASFYSLATTIGSGPAASMLLTGHACDAARAERFGLLTDVYPPEQLLGEALALAERIASRSPLSVEAAKRCLRQVPDLSADQAFELLGREVLALSASEDHKEALRAFFERRAGVYQRR